MTMNIWTKQKLGNIYKFQYGKGNKNPSDGGKYPVYGAGSTIGYFDEFNAEDSPVIGHMGANCGKVIFGKGKHFVTYNGIMALIKKGNDSLFGYYTLLSKDFRKSIRGSAQPFISYDLLNNVEILLPDLPTQTRIASVLSAYDDLIENNEKRIRVLEEMAQLLYTEWFVKFKFPGHEKIKMIDSKSEYGLIPEGWEAASLFDLTSILSGGTPKTDKSEYWDGEIKFYTPKDAVDSPYVLETERTLSEVGLTRCNSQLYPQNTVFITARGTVGNVNLSGESMAINQSCYALIGSQSVNQYFLFISIKNAVIQLKSKTHGAVFATIIIDTFKHIKVVKPSAETMQAFSKLVEPFFKEILLTQKKNKELSKIRDLLIPQLVTGKKELK